MDSKILLSAVLASILISQIASLSTNPFFDFVKPAYAIDTPPPSDSDGDGVPDDFDNCPTIPNPSQEDRDVDGIGNACDVCVGGPSETDTDGDTVCDSADLCPGFDDGTDTDGDTVPDGCDVCPLGDDRLDADSDGVPNFCDNCPVGDSGDLCDDENSCTVGETCQGGSCTAGTPPSCDNDSQCPSGSSCQQVGPNFRQCVPVTGLCPGCIDTDGDRYGVGSECLGIDCDDNDPTINPGADEVCDGIDNDCDDTVDESLVQSCDDGNACTTDFCDGTEASCNFTPVVDGIACGSNLVCQSGECVAEPFPLTLSVKQIKLKDKEDNTDRLRFRADFTLASNTNGIDPATEQVSIKLSTSSGIQFYPDIDFNPITGFDVKDKKWKINDAERTRTGIEKFVIQKTNDPNTFKLELVDKKTILPTTPFSNVVVKLTIGDDEGQVEVSLPLKGH